MQLAEGAAGQKVVVKMVPASKAQQDAAQAAAPARAPATNGHAEPIERVSATEPSRIRATEESGQQDRHSKSVCSCVLEIAFQCRWICRTQLI